MRQISYLKRPVHVTKELLGVRWMTMTFFWGHIFYCKVRARACVCVCVCAYVHSPWKLHLSGSVGLAGNRSAMLCWAHLLHRCFRVKHLTFLLSQIRSGQNHDLTSVRLAFRMRVLQLPLWGIVFSTRYIVSRSASGGNTHMRGCNLNRNPVLGKVLKKTRLFCLFGLNVAELLRRALLGDAVGETS